MFVVLHHIDVLLNWENYGKHADDTGCQHLTLKGTQMMESTGFHGEQHGHRSIKKSETMFTVAGG